MKKISAMGAGLSYAGVLLELAGLLPCGDAAEVCVAMSRLVGGPPEIFHPLLDELLSKGFIRLDGGRYAATDRMSNWLEEQLIGLAKSHEKATGLLHKIYRAHVEDLLASAHQKVAVWGTGAAGARAAAALEEAGKTVTCFIETVPPDTGSRHGRHVVSFEQAMSNPSIRPDAVLISSNAYKIEIESLINSRLPVFHLFNRNLRDHLARATGHSLPPVALFTVPKSGTHLLFRAVSLLPGLRFDNRVYSQYTETDPSAPGPFIDFTLATRPGRFICEHCSAVPALADAIRSAGIKVISMIRDPRDVLVSLYFFLTYGLKDHPYSRYLCEKFPGKDERLMALITGRGFDDPMFETLSPEFHFNGWDIGMRFGPHLGWTDEDFCYETRYEWLVGEGGGGSREIQIREVKNIAAHIGVNLEDGEAECIADSLYDGTSATFREGKTGGWRKHFTPEHISAFKDAAGDILVSLGYEKDTGW